MSHFDSVFPPLVVILVGTHFYVQDDAADDGD